MMRLLSYNVHGCHGTEKAFVAEGILEVISDADAEIVALQEVYDDDERDRSFLRGLERLGYQSVIHGATMRLPGGTYGNVLMTRQPVLWSEMIDLSPEIRGDRARLLLKTDLSSAQEPRGAIHAGLETCGREIEILTTHLGLIGDERQRQLDRLSESWKRNDTDAVRILLGDLNEWNPWTARNRMLRNDFGAIPHPKTFPAKLPLLRLDRVCVLPKNIEYRVEAISTGLTKKASDHLPLLAIIDL